MKGNLPLLDPTLDLVFKLLFGDPNHKLILIALLTAILKPVRPIIDVEILNPEIPREALFSKGIAFDVLVRLDSGALIDIEMQNRRTICFRARLIYYWSRGISMQLHRGDPYDMLQPVGVVALTNYVELETDRLQSVFEPLEIHDHSRLVDTHGIRLIEMPKFEQADDREDSDLALRRWVQFFRAKNNDEILKRLSMEDPMIGMAHEALRTMSADPFKRDAAEERAVALNLYTRELHARHQQGLEQGREQGLEQGREQGLEQGREQGLVLGQARSLLRSLSARGIALTPDARQRVETCNDLETLDAWLDRAVTMNPGEVLFTD